MSDAEELKKRLKEILRLVRDGFFARVQKIIFEFQSADSGRRTRIWIALALSFIFLGNVLLTAISKGKIQVPGFLGPLGLESFMANSSPGVQGDKHGDLHLCNFEEEEDLSLWKKDSVSISLSNQHAIEGSQSARLVMQGGVPWSGITLEEVFTHQEQTSNWIDYDSFQFYLFNPGNQAERLLFQIKDQWNRKYKSDFILEPGRGVDVAIPIKTIGASINVRKIDQLSIFRWAPRDTKEFYLDNIRLVRSFQKTKTPPQEVTFVKEIKKLSFTPVDYGFKSRRNAWKMQPSEMEGDVVRVPFVITNENEATCVQCPMEGSIPFPMGEVTQVQHLRLRNAYDQEIPFQPRVLSRWPDGSIKWMAPHFVATVLPSESMGLYMDYGSSVRSIHFASSLNVQEKGNKILVSTGPLRAVLSKKEFFLFDEVSLDRNGNGLFEPEESMVSKAPLFLTAKNKEFRLDRDRKNYKIEIEEAGPLRVVLKASGWFQSEDGQRFCQALLRYYFYQGQNYVKVSHSFIYTGYPANTAYQPYQKLKLPENETVASLGMRLPVTFAEPLQTKVTMGAQAPEMIDLPESNRIRLLQLDWKKAEIQTDGQEIPGGDYYSSWMDVSDGQGGVSVSLRNLRENFPKALSVDRVTGELQIDLWPKEAGDLNLATTAAALGPQEKAEGSAFGLGKTHELFFYFHERDAVQSRAPERVYGFEKRMVIRNNPYWVEATGALGRLFPVSDKYASQEKMLDRLFDWAARHPKKFQWYGMLHYGDTLSWYRFEDKFKKYNEPGWHPEGRWGWFHTEGVGNATGALLQFVRSGLWKYFEFGEAAARHAMDIQTIHYSTITRDERLERLLNSKMSQVGSMHRHSAMHWSGRSDDATHTNVLGLILYYHLTGDERALDVIHEIGDFFLSQPYGGESSAKGAPHRAMANTLWGDVLLYEVTGEEQYKKDADKIAAHYVKGQQEDGSFLMNYRAKNDSWSGEKNRVAMENHALGALIAYHSLTQDEKTKETILKLVKYCTQTPVATANSLHGVAYAYWLTQDAAYLAAGERALQWLARNQHSPRDPMLAGLIYDKPAYFRSMQLLSSVPYLFSALEEGFHEALDS